MVTYRMSGSETISMRGIPARLRSIAVMRFRGRNVDFPVS